MKRWVIRFAMALSLIFATIVIAVLAGAAWGLASARSDPVVRKITFTLPGIPRGTAPLRLALVSDIHVGNRAMPVERLNRIVGQINALHPDAVLIDGDLVNGAVPQSPKFQPGLFIAPLSRLKAPLGTYAGIGNHDSATNPAQIKAALHRAGVRVVSDSAARLGPIALIGIDYDDADRTHIAAGLAAARDPGGVPVLMTHAPPHPADVPAGISLVLAGHTHCGQIVLGPWDNSWDLWHHERRFDPRFRCGVVRTPHYAAVVTAGLGAASDYPYRINAPPDIWMITLIPQP
jgi:predicted MPP superfamily phosphohydrolase